MKSYIIAYDFGTGGIKASLYNAEGNALCFAFEPYQTYYPYTGWHEQRPDDWWTAICSSTKKLLASTDIDAQKIEALAISGHSLGVVPLDEQNNLLRSSVPIWSDIRASEEAAEFLAGYGRDKWYMKTGNGFTEAMYSAFKLMWYKKHEGEMFSKICTVLGTKDYINLLLTGEMATDYSYASGCGFYDLIKKDYDLDLLRQMGLSEKLFPEILESTQILGTLKARAAEALGLPRSVKVACGGVDNACMALGARGIRDGRVYTSLGSSSWIAVTSNAPILDVKMSPFVFAHIIPEMYTSATSIFSAGSSLQWVRNELCKDILKNPKPYDAMNALAASSPVGANKLLFNPSLAGGAGADKTPNICGAFVGLKLKHGTADIIRATMEGVAFALRIALDNLKKMKDLKNEMLFVGGGTNSDLWMQIFADIYGMDILRTNIGQDAGSLGAAAIAAVGCHLWKNFDRIDSIHEQTSKNEPDTLAKLKYDGLYEVYKQATDSLADLGDALHVLNI